MTVACVRAIRGDCYCHACAPGKGDLDEYTPCNFCGTCTPPVNDACVVCKCRRTYIRRTLPADYIPKVSVDYGPLPTPLTSSQLLTRVQELETENKRWMARVKELERRLAVIRDASNGR